MFQKTRSLFIPTHHFFWFILLFSAVIHITALSTLNSPLFKPTPVPEYVEVELVYPEPIKPPPAKKIKKQPIIKAKPKPAPKPVNKPISVKKESVVENTKEAPIVSPTPASKQKPESKPVPVPKQKAQPTPVIVPDPIPKEVSLPKPVIKPKPVPKPSLNIESAITSNSTPRVLEPNFSTKHQLIIPQIRVAEADEPSLFKKTMTEGDAIRAETPTNQQLKLDNASAPPNLEYQELKVSEVSPGEIKDEIKSNLKSKGDISDYKIVDKVHPSISAKTASAANPLSDSFLEGEIRQRKIAHQPQPPELDIDKAVTITLEFTVLPNGVVDTIRIIRKADPTLEQVAISLLREYRWEPLFESESVQRGIIHFTIRRKK